jgi:hypothetical protein
MTEVTSMRVKESEKHQQELSLLRQSFDRKYQGKE